MELYCFFRRKRSSESEGMSLEFRACSAGAAQLWRPVDAAAEDKEHASRLYVAPRLFTVRGV